MMNGFCRILRSSGNARPSCSRWCAALGFGIILLVGPAPSVAGTITAADSFRVASNLAMEVHLLHDANFSQATGSPIRRKERVLPRHVLQMARTVLRKANMLAWIYGSDTVPMGPMPTRKVRHDDVHATLQSSVWVIEGLRPIFNI